MKWKFHIHIRMEFIQQNTNTEEFVNALTGNLVTAYQELMQDVQKELSEETGDEKNN